MADQKVSQLTAATTPLSGTEQAYVVQGGNSRRTTVAAISATAPGTDLTFTAATRTLASSTGADVVLPLATDALDGLQSAAHRALTQALIAAGVTAAGTTTTIPHIHGDLAGSVYIHVKNTTAGTLAKGTPVRVTGAVGDTTTLEVAAADSASAGTMPAIGILSDSLAANASGHAVVGGELTSLDTSAYSIGQPLYVAAGGGLTATKPSSGTIQQVAIVGRVHASTGSVTVTISTQLSPTWDTAYSERLRWDGGATGLDAATGRASLGLGGAATLNVGSTAGTVAAGDDSRITGALSAATAATTYQPLDSDLTSIAALTTTSFGRSLLTQADAAAARTTIGAGTGNGTVTGVTATAPLTSSGGTAPVISTSMATNRLLGRSTAGTGVAEEIQLGANLTLSGGVLSASVTGGGGGTVTSVGLSLPGIFTVSGSPVTSSGTLTGDLATQAANVVFAGPITGAAAAPTFRALVAADLPGTGVTAASYGSASQVAGFTVDAQGRLTAASNTSISIPATAISDSTATGRSVLIAADAAAGRSALSAAASGAIGSSGLTMASARLLGRTTAGTGAPEEISVGSGLSLSGGTLTATGGGGGSSFAGYAVGNWIQPAIGTVAAGTANAINTIYLYPLIVNRSITVSELGARVTATSAGGFQLAVYASSNGLPTGTPLASTLAISGASATTVIGLVTPFNLTAGTLYWAAFNCDVAITMQVLAAGSTYYASIVGSPSLLDLSSTAIIATFTRYVSQTYGTWPDLTGVTTTVSAGTGTQRGALCYLKVSALL